MNLTITQNLGIKAQNSAMTSPLKALKMPFAGNKEQVDSSNLAPLSRDTVSFGAKPPKGVKKAAEKAVATVNGLRADKVGGDYANGIPRIVAQRLYDDTVVSMGYFENMLHKHFEKLVADENNPTRIIAKIDANHKPVDSIDEKLNALAAKERKSIEDEGGLYTFSGMNEAKKYVPDIVRGRVILRDSSKKSVKTVLQAFAKMLKEEPIKFTEIENYYPEISSVPDWVRRGYQKDLGMKLDEKQIKQMTQPGFFSYPKMEDLKEFERVARAQNKGLQIKYGVDRPNGYQALHVNGELPDGTPFEVQILGEHICEFASKREADVYKTKCNKPVKNPVLAERLAPLGDKKESALREEHTEYTRWVNIGERMKAPENFSKRKSLRARYLSAPKSISDRGLGYNQLVVAKRQGEIQMQKAKDAKSANSNAKAKKS